MKVILLSDSHGRHNEIDLPEGDLLVVAGDLTVFGRVQDLTSFGKWLEEVVPMYKYGAVIIAGNHDVMLDPNKHADLYRLFENMFDLIPNVFYLNDSGICINGYNIWGSPITPEFCNWAFNRERGPSIQKHWDIIPDNTDILITHGPPMGIRDAGLGCSNLGKKIRSLDIKLHVFGHIHPPYGQVKIGDTLYVNAAQCEIVNNKYVLVNKPIIVDLL